MIDIKELMIGNHVWEDYSGQMQVSLIDVENGSLDLRKNTNLPSGRYFIEDVEPIPLTEEWLIKFQLPQRELMPLTNLHEYSIRNEYEIYCHMDEAGNCLFWEECDSPNDFFIIKCDTVHTFQNIFKILNPHEKLTIK